LISALTIFVSFKLAKWQADQNWQRELTQRDNERKEQDRKDKLFRQIDALNKVLTTFSRLPYLSKLGFDYYAKNRRLFDEDRAIILAAITGSTFINQKEIQECLNNLYEINLLLENDGDYSELLNEVVEIKYFIIHEIKTLEEHFNSPPTNSGK